MHRGGWGAVRRLGCPTGRQEGRGARVDVVVRAWVLRGAAAVSGADVFAVTGDTPVRADVAVVGAGPAGLAVAAELVRRGRSVCLLEAARSAAPAWEPLDTADSVGLAYPLEASRGASLGGSSARWDIATEAPGDHVRLAELDPADLRERSWVPRSGWPLSADELRPHYDRARELFGLSPVHAAAGGPGSGSGASSAVSRLAATGVRTRRFEFGSRDRLLDALLEPLRGSPRVTVLRGATVTAVEADVATGRVRALRVVRGEGDRGFEVVAGRYVLAGGGIETPRLLLASRDPFSCGLGNTAGWVGRCFMEHPHYTSGLWQPADQSLLADRELWDIRGETPVQDKFRLGDEVTERERLPQVVFRLQPGVVTPRLAAARDDRPSRRSRRAAREVVEALAAHRRPERLPTVMATLASEAPRLGAWGLHLAVDELLRRGGAARTPTVFRMRAMAEQIPNPDSRVYLGSDRDRLGVPRARLDWRLSRADLQGLHRAQLHMKAAIERAGLGLVHPLTDAASLPPALGGGFHHMGTTRMADDPRQGVVDRNCRVHEVENLYVAGSAVFPTGGYVNPTLTIVALASRLGQHLADA